MRNGWNWKYPLSYMYPAHTQLVAKWSSPSIGDQRATGWQGDEQCEHFWTTLPVSVHLASSHFFTWVGLPGQLWLPSDSGSKQARALILSPSPQVAVHSDHSPQSCHWVGSTAKISSKSLKAIISHLHILRPHIPPLQSNCQDRLSHPQIPD